MGWSAGVGIFSLGKKNSLRSDTFVPGGKKIPTPTLTETRVFADLEIERPGFDPRYILKVVEVLMIGHIDWKAVCTVDDLIPESGVAVWTEDEPVAVFYLPHRLPALFAISHTDPGSCRSKTGGGCRA